MGFGILNLIQELDFRKVGIMPNYPIQEAWRFPHRLMILGCMQIYVTMLAGFGMSEKLPFRIYLPLNGWFCDLVLPPIWQKYMLMGNLWSSIKVVSYLLRRKSMIFYKKGKID